MFDIQKHLTIKEVAEKLGYTTANVSHLIRTGKIPAVKRGRRWFVTIDGIDKFLLSCGNAPELLS